MDTIGQQGGLEEHRPILPEIEDHCVVQSTSEGFEILNDKEVCKRCYVLRTVESGPGARSKCA